MTVPWDEARRARAKAKIDKESDRVAARLGAVGVVLVVFFEDGDSLHMMDGGRSPVPFKDLYRNLISATEIAEAGGGFVQ